MRRFSLFCLIFLICVTTKASAGISYTVDFQGLNDPAALKTIKSLSQLTTLKRRPPVSVNALRYRAESDVPDILKVLHAHGYYEASVDIRIDENENIIDVRILIQPGPVYKIESYTIDLHHGEKKIFCEQATLKNIGILLGKPAWARQILNSEMRLMQILAECGYPLASVEERSVIADGSTKGVRITLNIETGPLSHFGALSLLGLRDVRPRFIDQKVLWQEGEIYDSRIVESTQRDLINTGLFTSTLITHAESLDENDLLPMKIEVTESKHRSINLGASYQTVFGPGLTFGWENRNLGGMGRKLSLQGDITRISHAGTATLLIPDFREPDQELVSQAIAMRESITAYVERSYSVASHVDRKIGRRLRFTAGGKVERLLVTSSVDNGEFTLIEVPLYVRWSSANSLLNPTRGATLEYRAVPTVNLSKPATYYLLQEISQSTYFPLALEDFLVFAQQMTFGFILSPNLSAVPIPKRFLGGSEEELRGYRYRTVSPLKGKKPKGGRAALYYTAEARFRLSETIGLVPFFDMGAVYTTQLPRLKGKWFKSVGLGLRYFSFLGPLRFDVGVPLDRRRGIDPPYRLYITIGQTF
jgi:translocation and assembly module TamA